MEGSGKKYENKQNFEVTKTLHCCTGFSENNKQCTGNYRDKVDFTLKNYVKSLYNYKQTEAC